MADFWGAFIGAAIPVIAAGVGWLVRDRRGRTAELRLLASELTSNWKVLDRTCAFETPIAQGAITDSGFRRRQLELARALTPHQWDVVTNCYEFYEDHGLLRGIYQADDISDLAPAALSLTEGALKDLGRAAPPRYRERQAQTMAEIDVVAIRTVQLADDLERDTRLLEEATAKRRATTPRNEDVEALDEYILGQLRGGKTVADVAQRIRELFPKLPPKAIKEIDSLIVADADRVRSERRDTAGPTTGSVT